MGVVQLEALGKLVGAIPENYRPLEVRSQSPNLMSRRSGSRSNRELYAHVTATSTAPLFNRGDWGT